MNPADPITTIRCSHPADPAINWKAQGATEAVLEHLRRRDPETLARIPVADGQHLTLVTLRALTHGEMRHLLRQQQLPSASPFDIHELACGMAVEAIQCGGARHEIAKREGGGLKQATDAGAEELWSRLGMQGIEELGALAIQRARLGDAGPFALPAGVGLGRSPR